MEAMRERDRKREMGGGKREWVMETGGETDREREG